jgi:hypothetical protein
MPNAETNQHDQYGNAIIDWTTYPSVPETPFNVIGTLIPEPIKNRQGATVAHKLVILVQSEEDYQYDVVSKVALSGAIHVELIPTAQNGEYGILRIAGDGAILNMLCHLRTFSFAYFAHICVTSGKLNLKIRDADGPFIPHAARTLHSQPIWPPLPDLSEKARRRHPATALERDETLISIAGPYLPWRSPVAGI